MRAGGGGWDSPGEGCGGVNERSAGGILGGATGTATMASAGIISASRVSNSGVRVVKHVLMSQC